MTMSSHQSARSVTDVWPTPPEWIEALGGASTFDLDPCMGCCRLLLEGDVYEETWKATGGRPAK